MFKLVICDLDGFLLEGVYFSDYLEKEHGVSHAEFLSVLRGEVMSALAANKPSFPIWEPHLATWGLKITGDEFFKLWFEKEATKEVAANFEIAKKIKNQVGLAIVLSDNFMERAAWIRQSFPSLQMFDKLYFSSETGFTKATEEAYKKVMQDYNVQPQEVLFIDDDKTSVELAATLGIKGIIYKTTEQLVADLAGLGLNMQ